MARKQKTPFWLGLLLGLLLGMLIILVAIAPQSQDADVLQAPVVKQSADAGPAKSVAKAVKAQPQQAPSLADSERVMLGHPVVEPVILPAVPEPSISPALAGGHGVALILDDVGYDLTALKRLLALSVPIAVSVLPDSPFARQAAELGNAAGQVVMLHLPMQPEDPSLLMGESFLHKNMSRANFRATFLRDLEKVPHVQGVNNHMGSQLTQLEQAMSRVMRLCREKQLFFVDSKTSAHSVAARAAEQAGLAWAARSIFLDHEMTIEAMKHAWQRARTCMEKKLSCVVIAHPRAKTVTFLENYISAADASHMVSIKDLLQASAPVLKVARP